MRNPGVILVVDAYHAVADLIQEILRDDGYIVSVAHDLPETLAAITMHQPALVLLDDRVASLNTDGLRAHITRRHGASVPIITTTTNTAVATALAGRDSWACLMKPFSLNTLTTLVSHYVPQA